MSKARTLRSHIAGRSIKSTDCRSWRPNWPVDVNEDPVRLGLVASLARPGGNLTGINVFNAELVAKRLEFLRELVPAATRLAVLVNPANATTTESTLRDVEPAARAMGLRIQVFNAS